MKPEEEQRRSSYKSPYTEQENLPMGGLIGLLTYLVNDLRLGKSRWAVAIRLILIFVLVGYIILKDTKAF